MDKIVKHRSHFSKYGFKQFTIPNKENVKVLYEGSTEFLTDDLLERAKLDIGVIIINKVKFINIWEEDKKVKH